MLSNVSEMNADILAYIARHDNVKSATIREAFGLNHSSCSHTLTQLDRVGSISRVANRGRALLISVTDEARNSTYVRMMSLLLDCPCTSEEIAAKLNVERDIITRMLLDCKTMGLTVKNDGKWALKRYRPEFADMGWMCAYVHSFESGCTVQQLHSMTCIPSKKLSTLLDRLRDNEQAIENDGRWYFV